MRGRKKIPTQLKILRGNPSGRPLPKNEPVPRGSLKQAPAWFDARHKKLWERVVASAPKGVLKKIDAGILEIWVCATIQHEDAATQLRKQELTITTPGGLVKPNPLIVVMRTAAQIMIKAASEMGFTPASRARVTISPDDPQDEELGDGNESDQEKSSNPFARFTVVK